MKQLFSRILLAGLVATSVQGCASSPGGAPGNAPTPAGPPMQPYTEADVEFISGMIPHHTQAILISGWAPSHEANPEVRRLTERIVVGQSDDLVLMKQWLSDRGKPIPATGGHDHASHMPGMLTAEQMAQLDGAKGTAFDRLFLTFMIQHHEGALLMVNKLFGSSGAANDDFVYKMGSDIHAEQETEIERMKLMLASLPSGENRP
jgi:uncharacterized protein (DUF305 family)